jgi:seryl-tRNA synthetase
MIEALKRMQAEGYTLYTAPTLIKGFNLFGSGHFPFGKDNIYQVSSTENEKGEIDKEPLYLTGTAETSLGGYYADEIIKEEDLPIKMCGFSPCYRKEIGTYGKDMKGIYRIHEFLKVEQFIICKDSYEISEKYHEELMSNSEEFLQELELPYRIIRQCTGDMGAGKYKMYDIETYMPAQTSRDCYGETHSASNLGDWQARRYNIKYEGKDGEKHFVHTLNNTMIASPRILIAIMENYQQEDGSIKVPKILQQYVGKELIKKENNE